MFNAYYNFLLEFSYWPIFSQQVYSFIVGMYFLDIFIAMGLESMLCESLLIAPIDVCINVIENTMTMGAASFVDFMVSFMVGLSITMIDRLYLGLLLIPPNPIPLTQRPMRINFSANFGKMASARPHGVHASRERAAAAAFHAQVEDDV